MKIRQYYLDLLNASRFERQRKTQDDERIRKGLSEWIVLHEYCNSHVSLERLASSWGVPHYEVTRFLKEYTGTKFTSLRTMLRIEDSEDLLSARNDMTAADIARAVGINDINNFRRAFTRQTGFNPGLWRDGGGHPLKCRIIQLMEGDRSRCL